LQHAAELGVLAALDDRARTRREATITAEARTWLVGTFTEQIGRAFEARLGRAVPDAPTRQALTVAALLTYVRVEPDDDPELRALCHPAFGVQLHLFRAAIEPLEAAGHLSRKGSFVEATPPILANRLAARIVQGQPVEVMAVFQALADGGRRRLLRRLAQLQPA
jgi:hypothetical protein